MSLPSGIEVKSANNNIDLSINAENVFSNDVEIQNSVALLAKDILEKRTETATEAGFTGFVFGADSSAANAIDTFSKVAVSLNISPVLPKINELAEKAIALVKDILNKPLSSGPLKDIKLDIKEVVVDVHDTNVLSADVDASLTGLPIDIQIDLPFIGANVGWNAGELVYSDIRNMKFVDGSLKTQALIKFMDNKPAAQSIFQILGNILFHRKVEVSDTVAGHSVGFGYSPETQVQTFSKIKLSLELKSIVADVTKYFDEKRPMEILDIQAVIMEEGIVCHVTFSVAAPFLKVKANILAAVGYQENGQGPVETLVTVPVYDIKLPSVSIVLQTVLENASTAKVIKMGIDKLLSFVDFASDAKLGYLVVTGSNGKKLTAFEDAWFGAGELILWSPINADVLLRNPGEPDGDGIYNLPVEVSISFRNGGSLHLDVGRIVAGVKSPTGQTLLGLESKGDIVILNYLEGADVPENPPSIGTLAANIPIKDLDLQEIIKTIKALLEGDKISLDFNLIRGGKPVSWANTIFKQILQVGLLSEIGPILSILLLHIVLEISVDDQMRILNFFEPVLNRIAQWVWKFLPKLVSVLPITKGNSTLLPMPTKLSGKKVLLQTSNFKLIGH
jgi:hypothetical protein